MPQQRRRSRIIIGLVALGLLAGVALTAGPAQAVDGPYYAEPAWDRKMASANRFVVLTNWASAAVLDKETGLVWEQSPSAINNFTWSNARFHCTDLTTGGRKGWRLPLVQELASLVDPSVTPGPTLPAGHPFVLAPIVNVHWTATTTNFVTNTLAWSVNFDNGAVLDSILLKLTGHGNAWCVRGGNNADVY